MKVGDGEMGSNATRWGGDPDKERMWPHLADPLTSPHFTSFQPSASPWLPPSKNPLPDSHWEVWPSHREDGDAGEGSRPRS